MVHGERLNVYTHMLGTALAVGGMVMLMIRAILTGDVWKIASVSIYTATLLLLYLFSTLYHGMAEGRARRVLHKLDHIAIYLLIAGTYTPFTLVSLRMSRAGRCLPLSGGWPCWGSCLICVTGRDCAGYR